jgi:hypothetical protein
LGGLTQQSRFLFLPSPLTSHPCCSSTRQCPAAIQHPIVSHRTPPEPTWQHLRLSPFLFTPSPPHSQTRRAQAATMHRSRSLAGPVASSHTPPRLQVSLGKTASATPHSSHLCHCFLTNDVEESCHLLPHRESTASRLFFTGATVPTTPRSSATPATARPSRLPIPIMLRHCLCPNNTQAHPIGAIALLGLGATVHIVNSHSPPKPLPAAPKTVPEPPSCCLPRAPLHLRLLRDPSRRVMPIDQRSPSRELPLLLSSTLPSPLTNGSYPVMANHRRPTASMA